MKGNEIRHRGNNRVQNINIISEEVYKNIEFVVQESPLTVLIGSSLHMRVIYHIFIVILLMLFSNTLIYDLIERGIINVGLTTIVNGFGDFRRGLKLWLIDLLIALLFYPLLLVFGWLGYISRKYPVLRPMVILLGWIGVSAVLIMIFAIPVYNLTNKRLEVGSACAVTCVMVRFMMKILSVAVACAPRCLYGKAPLPTFQHDVYFLFAPTLLYRDQYPRNNKLQKMTANGIRNRVNKRIQNEKIISEEVYKDDEFVVRESPLTVLIGSSLHMRTIYHIFIVIFVILCFDILITDFLDRGIINLGLTTMLNGFGDFRRGLKLWLYDLLIVLLFYPLLLIFEWFGSIARKFPALRPVIILLGWIGVSVVLIMIPAIPVYDLTKKHLEMGSSITVTLEMIRFMMKVLSVAVACAPRCLYGKAPLPSFQHYVYFLFAPTLLYRDQYPRTEKIRWRKALFHILEVTAIMFLYSFLWEKFVITYWSDYGKQNPVQAGMLVRHIFVCMFPATFCFLCLFYCILHAWMNAWAEVLTFGDRHFYEEWWVASRFAIFYRHWNRIVYSWLREHIYRPLTPHVGRSIATYIVFFVSSISHEVILALSFGFFYPVLLILFGLMGLVSFPLTSGGYHYPNFFNLFMWWGFFIGNGLLWNMYTMEHFARKNCPPSPNDSYFIPKSWSCPEIMFKPNWTFQNPLHILF